MQSRIQNPALAVPDAMQALMALGGAIKKAGLPETLTELVHLRASQINGCSVCLDMHARILKSSGESDERLFAVAAWRDAPYFTEAERAALALAERATRLSDSEDPVPDAVWNEAAKHFNESQLAALVLSIALINVWNRLNVVTGQVAGEWINSAEAQKWTAKAKAS